MYAQSQYRIDELAALVHPRDGHRKLLVMIDAYLDEAGIHDGAVQCVIAGYFGSRSQWRRFEADWKRTLYRYKVPLKEFHGRNLFPKLTGFFKHKWKGNREEFLEAVVSTIARHKKIHPLCFGLFVRDFKSLTEEEARYLTGAAVNLETEKLSSSGNPNKPYFFLFGSCVVQLCRYAHKKGKAHFFCGLNSEFAGYAIDVFNRINASGFRENDLAWKNRLGTLAFPLAKDTPQMQAADFLATLTYHHIRDVDENKKSLEFAQPIPLLAKCIKNALHPKDDLCFFTKDNLDGWVKLREKLPSILK